MHIIAHNRIILAQNNSAENDRKCNCSTKNKKLKRPCPLNGNCLEKNLIYEAKVETKRDERIYIGSTVNEFKTRWTGHNESFRKEKFKTRKALSKFTNWKFFITINI